MITPVQIHLEMGIKAHARGNIEAAIACYESVLSIDPSNIQASKWLGTIEAQRKNFLRARQLFERALSSKCDPDFLTNYANVLQETGDHIRALVFYERAHGMRRDQISLTDLASCHSKLNEPDRGLRYADDALKIDPMYSRAWGARGLALCGLGRLEEALASYNRSLELCPDSAETWNNRGVTLSDLRRLQEAVSSFERAIALQPDYAEAWSNLGLALFDLKRFTDAIACYDRAIDFKTNHAEAWSNRGVALNALRRHKESIASYERAIELKPDYANALTNYGTVLCEMQRDEEAIEKYEKAIKLKPDVDLALGDLIHTKMRICDWADLEDLYHPLRQRMLAGKQASNPFVILGLFDEPILQTRCAELHANGKLNFIAPLGLISMRGRGSRIRVGYFSMDFYDHAVSHLITEVIERHNRERFEVYGFSFGPNTGDPLRVRLENAFDRFIDVQALSDIEIARLSREQEIDIAIDLGGYTKDSRPQIFAHRAAPIQINYLGYPGTMGSKCMDYFIGDQITIDSDNVSHFYEKIIYLPNSFQPNPSQRPIEASALPRKDYGLPESSFVFCCFNNSWKITPEVFKSWVRILKEVDNSVLWLQQGHPTSTRNILEAFEVEKVSPSRIVFASKVPNISDHLVRYQRADLFLDTFPYGAHTTGSDALWVGLPVLTRSGQSFASRVASSLLNAIGLPELITKTPEDYERLAVELALNPDRITSLKAKLAKNRSTHPLFNTALFTQHLESAYQTTYDRYHNKLEPDHIYVKS